MPYCRLAARGRKPDGLLIEIQLRLAAYDRLTAVSASLAACLLGFNCA